MTDQAKRLTQAIKQAALNHEPHGSIQWYVSDLAIDCNADEFWDLTEQALNKALRNTQ